MPAIVTVLLPDTNLSAKVAVALVVDKATLSPDTSPDNAAPPLFNKEVAAVLPSYTLLLAVIPVTESNLVVIRPVVTVGCTKV